MRPTMSDSLLEIVEVCNNDLGTALMTVNGAAAAVAIATANDADTHQLSPMFAVMSQYTQQ